MTELLWQASTALLPHPGSGSLMLEGVKIEVGVQDLGFLGLRAVQDGYVGGTKEDPHPGLVCHQDPFVDRGEFPWHPRVGGVQGGCPAPYNTLCPHSNDPTPSVS